MREYEEILTSGDLYEREYLSLVKSLGSMADRLSEEEIYKINEMNILIYRGMLAFMRENPGRFTPEEATEKQWNICVIPFDPMRCFKKASGQIVQKPFFFGLQRLPNQPKHIVVGDLVDLAFGEALLLQAL